MSEFYHPIHVGIAWAQLRREQEAQRLSQLPVAEGWVQRTKTIAARHPGITWGIRLALLAGVGVLIPLNILASQEADRVLQRITALRVLKGGTIISPEPQPPVSSSADFLTKAWLELVMPTKDKEGKSVVAIMSELGYVAHSFVYPPSGEPKREPETLLAGDIGNRIRRVPVDMDERAFFDRFMTMNVTGSVNAKEPFSNIVTIAIVNPDQSVNFYALDYRGWVNIAFKNPFKNQGKVEWFIQKPTEELNRTITGFKIPLQKIPATKA